MRSVLVAIISAPFQPIIWAYRGFLRLTGAPDDFVESIHRSVLTNVICGGVIWAVSTVGGVFAVSAWNEALPDPCTRQKMCILIAGLDGDSDEMQTKYVAASLEQATGADQSGAPLQVIVIPRVVKRPFGGDLAATRAEAEKNAREWLSQMKGDVLIYGWVVSAGNVIQLHFVSAEGAQSGGNYKLDSQLVLPKSFDADLGTALAAVVASAAAPAIDDPGRYLVPVLGPVIGRLDRMVRDLPPTLPAASKRQILEAYAVATKTVGEQSGDKSFYEKSLAASQAELPLSPRDSAPLDWGNTQNNIGALLVLLGIQEDGTKRIEEGIAALRAALEERTRERDALAWATSKSNLGGALVLLGTRLGSPTPIEEAVGHLKDSLMERTRAREPMGWAETQNSLAGALVTLGEHEDGTARLEEGAAALREALKERTRERAPLLWATTQSNLGVALEDIGERETGTAHLEEALTAFHAALEERPRDKVPLAWATAQNNLGTALRTLGERTKDSTRIEEAIAAFKGALEEYQKAGAAYYVEALTDNLGKAETALAAMKKS